MTSHETPEKGPAAFLGQILLIPLFEHLYGDTQQVLFPLGMSPLGLLLLSKRLHPNLLVLATKQAVEDTSLKLDTVTKRQVLALVDHLLASLNRHLGVSRNRLSRLERLLHQRLIRRECPGCHTPLLSLCSRERLARENKLHGLGFADGAGQALAAARTRDCAELDLRLTKVGSLSAIDEIAHHGELTTAAQRVTRDGRENGLLDLGSQERPGLNERLGVCLGKCKRGHLLDVCAGREGLLGPGQDND